MMMFFTLFYWCVYASWHPEYRPVLTKDFQTFISAPLSRGFIGVAAQLAMRLWMRRWKDQGAAHRWRTLDSLRSCRMQR